MSVILRYLSDENIYLIRFEIQSKQDRFIDRQAQNCKSKNPELLFTLFSPTDF